MSRYRRPYCPGAAFHVTSRLTGRARLLEGPVAAKVVRILAESALRTDARVLGYAIMSTHLHLVVRQGEQPLSDFIQPALRRIALLVQHSSAMEGHVFERRYRDQPCLSARHLRDAIAYAHLNPVRAGTCRHPDGALFTSQSLYSGMVDSRDPMRHVIQPAWQLFATMRNANPSEWQRDYREYVAHRLACDAAAAAHADPPLPMPPALGGDDYFAENFTRMIDRAVRTPPIRPDLRDIALEIVSRFHADLPLDTLRGPSLGSRRLQRLRTEIIQRASDDGYSGVAIARFFAMSPSRVSEIARAVNNWRIACLDGP